MAHRSVQAEPHRELCSSQNRAVTALSALFISGQNLPAMPRECASFSYKSVFVQGWMRTHLVLQELQSTAASRHGFHVLSLQHGGCIRAFKLVGAVVVMALDFLTAGGGK